MNKKVKIILGIVLFLVVAMISIPFIFKDKIIGLVKQKINNTINAEVNYADADLSIFKDFPNASVVLEDLSVVNFEPFKGDTLFSAKEVRLALKITDLLKKTSEELSIQSFSVIDSKINIITNKQGVSNYDIAKKTEQEDATENKEDTASMRLNLMEYSIENAQISYVDDKGKLYVKLADFNHSGSGDLSSEQTTLKTKTATNVSFKMDKTSYADNVYIDLEALLDLDFKNKKFSFLENTAHINQLPLIFDGFLKLNDKNQEVNINFKTPSSDFRNFLALVPKQYAKNISEVKTTGDFIINGRVNGIVDEKHIPKIDVNIKSNNASFKYPDLPKSVQNIHINADIKNSTGLVKDTYVNINNVSFKIDDNVLKAKTVIRQLTTNPTVNATLNGVLNLAHLDKVYPLETNGNLSGLVKTDLTTAFDIEAVQKNIVKRIKNNGTVSITDFMYNSKDIANAFDIENAAINFQPGKIFLTRFDAKTGRTDLNVTGTIENLLGFLLSDKELKGSFLLKSNEFRVDDFMQSNSNDKAKKEDKNGTSTSKESLKIPAFLDIVVQANAKKVVYDNLLLENVTGKLILKNEKAILQHVTADMFDGKIALNGAVNTQPKTPVFNMKMGIQDFNIGTSISSIEMLQKLAPIAGVLDGKFSTDIDLNGALTDELTPDLNSIKGNAFARVLTQRLNPEKSKAMGLLNNKLSFIDLKKLNLDDIKTQLEFKDGKVNIKPFNIAYNDIDIRIGGSHGFDQSMSYDVTLDVPSKYLGSEVQSLLSKLDASNQNMKVPVTANVTGSFENPSVSTNMSSAVSNLTKKLVRQQKKKLVGGALDKILGGNTNTTQDKKDSTATAEPTTKNVIKENVKDILGGFLGSKKSSKKDTVK